MKSWFPFTDYDFYGYLASGALLLFALDYWHAGPSLLLGKPLAFMQAVLALSLAYVIGQIIAIPSSTLLEMQVANRLLRPPIVVLLNTSTWYEKLLSTLFIGRYYTQLSTTTRNRIYSRALQEEALLPQDILADPERLFAAAYRNARNNSDTARRVDDFRNQYGFARNLATSAFVASLLMFSRSTTDTDAFTLAWLSLILFVGMFMRYLKFYACFTGEVLKSYAHKEQP